MTIGEFIPSIVDDKLVLTLDYFTGGAIKNFTDWWSSQTREDWWITYVEGVTEEIGDISKWELESMTFSIHYQGYTFKPTNVTILTAGGPNADGSMSITLPAIKDTGIPPEVWESNYNASASGSITFTHKGMKRRDENVNFNIKIQNGPNHSHLMWGIAIQTDDESYNSWPVFTTVKDPSGENWSEPNEIVVDRTVTLSANQKGWANGLYDAWAYVWECEGEPGHWVATNELDSVFLNDAFLILPKLLDNIDNISGISHDASQGRCSPGVLFDWTNEEKMNAFFVYNGEPEMRYPTRDVKYDNYADNNEMICSMIKLYNFTGGFDVNFKWYREIDNTMLFEFNQSIPSGDHSFYATFSWIGKASWEINGRGIYRCEITPSGYGTSTLYFRIK